MNDTLANAMSVISNSEKLGRSSCSIKPCSVTIKRILDLFKDNLLLGDFTEVEDGRGNYLSINLLGKINKCGAIKPRYAVNYKGYEKYEKRYLPAKGFGFLVVSTSSGVMTHEDAVKKKIGGKLLAYIY